MRRKIVFNRCPSVRRWYRSARRTWRSKDGSRPCRSLRAPVDGRESMAAVVARDGTADAGRDGSSSSSSSLSSEPSWRSANLRSTLSKAADSLALSKTSPARSAFNSDACASSFCRRRCSSICTFRCCDASSCDADNCDANSAFLAFMIDTVASKAATAASWSRIFAPCLKRSASNSATVLLLSAIACFVAVYTSSLLDGDSHCDPSSLW
mmetsp:Transcript_10266/g.27251  ORF Transcript_10266/g.27251 Transcript_10266/m.27251 type:complete len:210 (+) Transcript_10266:465-1094(+)